jgi:hypothetical protein
LGWWSTDQTPELNEGAAFAQLDHANKPTTREKNATVTLIVDEKVRFLRLGKAEISLKKIAEVELPYTGLVENR